MSYTHKHHPVHTIMWLPPFPKHIPPFYIPFTRRASSPYAFAISLILYLFASCKMLLRQSSHHNTKTFSFPHRPPPPWLAQLSSLSTKNKPSFQFDQHHRGEFLLYLLPTMNQELHVATFERFLSDRGFRPSASHPLDLHLPPLRPNPVTHAPPPLRTHSSRPSVPSDVDRRQTPSSKTRERSRDEGHRPNLCRDEPEARPQKSTSNRPASSRRRRTRSTSPAPQWAHNAGRGVKKSATAVFQCEYCQMKFGRKHHKERHVDNLHRRVS